MKKTFIISMLLLLAVNAFGQEQTNDIKSLIKTKYQRGRPRDITFLSKIDMGIPGGDNWLVEWKNDDTHDTDVSVYSVNGEEVIEKFWTPSFDISERTDFDIAKDILGTQVGEGSCFVYDYNGDGYDDIFNYGFYGKWYTIEIIGYDPKKDKEVYYCSEIPFSIVDKKNGPAPVEFITYKGMKGFKVYYNLNYGEPDHPPKNIINEYYAWYFFAWDEGKREFVEIEEVEEETVAQPAEKDKNPQSTIEQTAITQNDDKANTLPLWAWFAIIGGAVVVVGGVVFVVKRKK